MKNRLTIKQRLLMGGLLLNYCLYTVAYAENVPVWHVGTLYLTTGEVLEGEITYSEEHIQLKDVVFMRTKNTEGNYNIRGYYFKELQRVVYYDAEWKITHTLARYDDKFYVKLVGNSDDLHLLAIPHKPFTVGLEDQFYLSYFLWYKGNVEYVQNFPRQFRKICESLHIDYCAFVKNTQLSPTDPKEQELLVFYFNKWRKNTNLIVKN